MNETYKNLNVALLSTTVVLGAFGLGVYGAVELNPTGLSAAVAAASPRSNLAPLVLSSEELQARAAVLYELKTGRVLYQKNANEQLPLASLTKLMAVQTVLSQVPANTVIEIEPRHLRPEGDSGLVVGQTLLLSDLIKLSLVASSNDAITAAAMSLGEDYITTMNAAAHSLGLTKTHFFNATGLDVTRTTSGAYGSAYDVARLAATLYSSHPEFFEFTTHSEVTVAQGDSELTAEATTVPLQDIPGFVAAKTGYTDLAGGNLVAIFDIEPGLTAVAVALGSTREGRFSDIRTLIDAARTSL